jgi:demethylmenaquinone methyltransferase/2-methoxy-6-polyprenyl-1,4-benzoquinol methylase
MVSAEPARGRWPHYETSYVRRRYDRLARFYGAFEWLFGLPRGIRRRAVERLELRPNDRVLEIGTGTGRNLSCLRAAVGARGHVYGVDISGKMLERAERLRARHGWSNVTLTHADALDYRTPEPVHGVLFSLSYATMPHHREVLQTAWDLLAPGGRVVILDAKPPNGARGRVLLPLLTWISRATVLGNPHLRPWEELAEMTAAVEMEQMSFGTYYICGAGKPPLSGEWT